MRPPTDIPKYRQLYEELKQQITGDHYADGQRLPSEARLEDRFGVSRITVGRAIKELQREGLVERRAGAGTYVKKVRPQSRSLGMSFGLLIPDLGRNEIFEPICRGMTASPLAGEHVLLWGVGQPSTDVPSQREHARLLASQYIARGVAGVFFAPLEGLAPEDATNHEIVASLEAADIPVVLLDRDYITGPDRSRHDLVGVDNRRIGFVLTEHLLNIGARRIAFLAEPRSATTVEGRIAGYCEALYAHGLLFDQIWVQRCHPDQAEVVGNLMTELKPDAFVCANDRIAGVLMRNLLALGYKIPEHVRIVGVDDAGFADMLPVPLTTFRQPCHELGLAAMATMIERIRRRSAPTRDVYLACELIIRESSGSVTQGNNHP